MLSFLEQLVRGVRLARSPYHPEMRLEDLRGPKVGDVVLFTDEQVPVLAAFHHHAGQAQWHTMNSLFRVAGNPVPGVVSDAIAVVEWWRTVESLTSLLHLIALRQSESARTSNEAALRSRLEDAFPKRWAAVARWFSDGTASAPRQTTRLVTELRDFRNAFEHRTRRGPLDIKASRLSQTPAWANLADAMEAMAICTVGCHWLRDAIPGFDLMPQVVASSPTLTLFVSLDRFASGFAFPAYHQVLSRLGLDSDITLYPLGPTLVGNKGITTDLRIKGLPGPSDIRLDQSVDLSEALRVFVDQQAKPPVEGDLLLPTYGVGDQANRGPAGVTA